MSHDCQQINNLKVLNNFNDLYLKQISYVINFFFRASFAYFNSNVRPSEKGFGLRTCAHKYVASLFPHYTRRQDQFLAANIKNGLKSQFLHFELLMEKTNKKAS